MRKKQPDLTCDVCHNEPGIAVIAMPGVPGSFAYGKECYQANAHPYDMIVMNTALVGGLTAAADWWVNMVESTLRHLGISRPQFNADLQKAIRDLDEDARHG